jgi:hypothetical protein
MYSPQLGRFIQPDSIVPYPVFSQSWNRFSYVMNNPINFIDPTGHQNCGPDNIYCGGLPENNYYSQPRPSLVIISKGILSQSAKPEHGTRQLKKRQIVFGFLFVTDQQTATFG